MALYFISFVALLFFFPKFTLWVVIPGLILFFIFGVFCRLHNLFTSVKEFFSKKAPSKSETRSTDSASTPTPKATPSPEAVKTFDDNEGFDDNEAFLARQRAMND